MSSSTLPLPVENALLKRVAGAWHRLVLTGILALSACLNLSQLSQNGYANTYYSAAVHSMLESWHNFFFASFDPGGLVSVDKPPLALWLQAASAKLLGFSGFSILLPQALAGIAAVGLLYLLVARVFGRVAGLVAALALAVSPVSVAVNRDNNPDALLAVLLVAAAYTGLRAVQSGRLRTLVLTAVLVGLAFNTKMLAAGLVVPGIGVAYLVFAKTPLRSRLVHGVVALVALVVVSGAWIAAVELTPDADRPYVGSTSDNSALSLALGYNGLGRVTGQEGGTSFGGGLGGAFSGTPGPLRLVNDALGDQGSWLLPLALVGLLSAALAAGQRRNRREGAALVLLGGWFVTAAAVLSYSSGIIHTYYVSALAPALAGLVGSGTLALWRNARRGGVATLLPLVAIAACGWLQLDLLSRYDYATWLRWVVAAGTVGALAIVAALASAEAWTTRARARLATVTSVVAIATLLAAPTVWAASTHDAPVNGVFPGAGPAYLGDGGSVRAGGGFPGGPGGGGSPSGGNGFLSGRGNGAAGPGSSTAAGGTDLASAIAYTEAHRPGSRFGLIVQSEQQAASAIIEGASVASMGGFTGRETVLTGDYLARLVRTGEARYFLLGSNGGFGLRASRNAAVSTIESVCTPVASSAWSSGSTSSTLYDCAGKADAIAKIGA
ncbi:MAG: glycosyltransferase family 39 protein [Gaiellales bacterium]